jgi:membrane-bound lytic murein transglycosylase B
MLTRRSLIAASAAIALPAVSARAQSSFSAFLDGLRAEARRDGISQATLESALRDIAPSQRVLELDRHQPEFTMTWAQYKARVLPAKRLAAAREAYLQQRPWFDAVWQRFRVNPGVIIGIWGLESNFGGRTGNFSIVGALATLAWDGRRASYFRSELINALRILDHGDVTPAGMTGSWAGAMGQPQFMPSSYLRYAVDFDGDGRRDIWRSVPDVLGSVGNYLGRSGWRGGEPWGQPISVPSGFDASLAGRDSARPLGEWARLGVRRADGSMFSRGDVQGSVLLPDGLGGEAYMVYANFKAIRRYNPSDFYALAVGLLGNSAA